MFLCVDLCDKAAESGNLGGTAEVLPAGDVSTTSWFGATLGVMDAASEVLKVRKWPTTTDEQSRVTWWTWWTWWTAVSRLTLHAGAVQLGLQQHPQPRHFLPLQLVQPRPHVVAHQVQLFAQAPVLEGEGGRHTFRGRLEVGAEPSHGPTLTLMSSVLAVCSFSLK